MNPDVIEANYSKGNFAFALLWIILMGQMFHRRKFLIMVRSLSLRLYFTTVRFMFRCQLFSAFVQIWNTFYFFYFFAFVIGICCSEYQGSVDIYFCLRHCHYCLLNYNGIKRRTKKKVLANSENFQIAILEPYLQTFHCYPAILFISKLNILVCSNSLLVEHTT